MKIFDSDNKILIPKIKPIISTIGCFDGIHIAHKFIIQKTVESANKLGGISMVITFEPLPTEVFNANTDNNTLNNTILPSRLTTEKERVGIFKALGIHTLLILPFTPKFAKLSQTDFVSKILADKLKVKKIIVGHDLRFGYNRKGDINYLTTQGSKLNFEVEIVQPIIQAKQTISSTNIRKYICRGDIEKASKQLGYKYYAIGKVIRGEGIGSRILQIPTANLLINKQKILPPNGVYAVNVYMPNADYAPLRAVANIGTRPTFKDVVKLQKTFEVHIMSFNENLYGKDLKVEFIKKIRDERKFESVKHLKKQIIKDIKKAEVIFATKAQRHKE